MSKVPQVIIKCSNMNMNINNSNKLYHTLRILNTCKLEQCTRKRRSLRSMTQQERIPYPPHKFM